jgi:hypothetical protein
LTGASAWFVAVGAALFEATGGLAVIAGFAPVLLLLLGAAGGDGGGEPGSELEHAASACSAAAVESA